MRSKQAAQRTQSWQAARTRSSTVTQPVQTGAYAVSRTGTACGEAAARIRPVPGAPSMTPSPAWSAPRALADGKHRAS
jgi:hypothetical protein